MDDRLELRRCLSGPQQCGGASGVVVKCGLAVTTSRIVFGTLAIVAAIPLTLDIGSVLNSHSTARFGWNGYARLHRPLQRGPAFWSAPIGLATNALNASKDHRSSGKEDENRPSNKHHRTNLS